MLGFLHKEHKFEIGERVEVKTADSLRFGTVRGEQGKGLYAVQFDDGDFDAQVSARTMKSSLARSASSKASTKGSIESSGRNHSPSSALRSMYARLTFSSSAAVTPAPSTEELPSSRRASLVPDAHRRSSSQDNSWREAATAPAALPAVSESLPDEDTDARPAAEKTPSEPAPQPIEKRKARRASDAELAVLQRVRRCKALLESCNNDFSRSALDLSGLQLRTMPEKVTEFYYLRELSVRKNDFTSVREIVRHFPSLTRLDAAFNNFVPLAHLEGKEQDTQIHNEEIESSPFAAFADAGLRLSVVDLSGCRLREIPPELAQQSKTLTTLILRKNELRELPLWLGDFKQLTRLDLADNALVRTPALCQLLEERLIRLSDLCLDRNPCLEETTIEDQNSSNNTRFGARTIYLLEKKEMLRSKALRKQCISRATDVRRRVIEREKMRLLDESSLDISEV